MDLPVSNTRDPTSTVQDDTARQQDLKLPIEETLPSLETAVQDSSTYSNTPDQEFVDAPDSAGI